MTTRSLSVSRSLRILLAVAFALGCAIVARAQEAQAPAPATAEEAEKESQNEIARQLANPISSTWSLQFQFNNFDLTNGRWNNNLLFQPVLPVSLTSGVNLITRPVVQVYNSVPYQTSTGEKARTTNFGDWTQVELFSPTNTGHWLLALGPTFIFPTGGSVYTSQGKFQIGPSAVVAYMNKEFIAGVFPQQWWSYAGDADRPQTSQMFLQPIFNVFIHGGWNVGYSGIITVNWEAPPNNRWTVPIGLQIGKVVKFGNLPVKFQIAGQYMVTQPDPVGQHWNIQLNITPVIPKLIQGVLFE